MLTHLVSDIDAFGVWEDDYERFLSLRAKAVSEELKKRLLERDIDRAGQAAKADAFEEDPAAFE